MATFTAFSAPLFDLALLRAASPEAAVAGRRRSGLESMSFTHALVALAAKLAMVDGAVNKAEYLAYNAIIPPSEAFDALRLRSLFMKHLGDAASALQYARQLAALTRGDAALHRDILQKLLLLATADAALNAAEIELLRAVADIFGIPRTEFKTLVGRLQVPQASPYDVLGIAEAATPEETRGRYLALVQKLHPDRYQAAGTSPDTLAMLGDQLAELNAAYDAIKRRQAKKSTNGGALARWWAVRNTKGANAS